jgi:hypothetical protein
MAIIGFFSTGIESFVNGRPIEKNNPIAVAVQCDDSKGFKLPFKREMINFVDFSSNSEIQPSLHNPQFYSPFLHRIDKTA